MTKLKTPFKAIIVILCSVILCSCLSIDRNIKLNKDSSGEETMKITFLKDFYQIMSSMTSLMDSTRRTGYLDSLYSDQMFLSQTKNKYDSIPGIKLIDIYSTKNTDSSNTITIKYQFDSIQKIGSSLSDLGSNQEKSKTIVTWNDEGKEKLFSYKYEQETPQGLTSNDSLADEMKKDIAQLFKGGSIHIQIEFPYEVISSNATSSRENILNWDYTLMETFMKGNMNLEAKMR